MRRIKITLSYDGTDYHGWQLQPEVPTIQGTLEKVVSEIEGKPVRVVGSGRTDAGAHALGQVAAFTLENPIPLNNLCKAMNRLLPRSIRVLETEQAAPQFHPRHAALAKAYEYRIFRGEICSPFERRYVHHFPYPLAVERVVQAAALFEGQHDFSAFAAADEKDAQRASKVRTIFSSRVEPAGDRLFYRVKGNGFLKHMVRNVVGTLLETGKGNLREDDIKGLLNLGMGEKAGPTAPACGLFLVSVEY